LIIKLIHKQFKVKEGLRVLGQETSYRINKHTTSKAD